MFPKSIMMLRLSLQLLLRWNERLKGNYKALSSLFLCVNNYGDGKS